MICEIYYFFRYGPTMRKRQKELGLVEFLKTVSKEADADGFAGLRRSLVGDLEGDVLEIGAGTGATFPYYGPKAKVAAIEPNDDLRAAAEEAANAAVAEIRVVCGTGEALPFDDASFDAVSASQVLCSVDSPRRTLEEFKRVLRPGGKIRLMEHVRSEHSRRSTNELAEPSLAPTKWNGLQLEPEDSRSCPSYWVHDSVDRALQDIFEGLASRPSRASNQGRGPRVKSPRNRPASTSYPPRVVADQLTNITFGEASVDGLRGTASAWGLSAVANERLTTGVAKTLGEGKLHLAQILQWRRDLLQP